MVAYRGILVCRIAAFRSLLNERPAGYGLTAGTRPSTSINSQLTSLVAPCCPDCICYKLNTFILSTLIPLRKLDRVASTADWLRSELKSLSSQNWSRTTRWQVFGHMVWFFDSRHGESGHKCPRRLIGRRGHSVRIPIKRYYRHTVTRTCIQCQVNPVHPNPSNLQRNSR